MTFILFVFLNRETMLFLLPHPKKEETKKSHIIPFGRFQIGNENDSHH
jgi:hypothetical protein